MPHEYNPYESGESNPGESPAFSRALLWGTKFSKYVPAQQAYPSQTKMTACAVDFIEVWPDCPFSIDWLIKDFQKRQRG